MKIKISPFSSLILFENEDYVVINKPPYISSLEDRNDELNILKLARRYNEKIQLCHRLDKQTSGVLVLSKNETAYKYMNLQFEKRTLEKEYHAVCDGLHDFKKLKIEKPLSVHTNGTAKIDVRHGKKSITMLHSIKAYKRHTLIHCKPETGRMHQIRIHLSYLNAPISGDVTYGGKPFYLSSIKRNYKIGKFEEEQPLIQRMALHAFQIRFKLLSGDYKEVKAPYPKDFKVLISQLEKNI
jgi:23S rRNA pseudouridine955/2504/2580 synthase